jgi:peptidyl-prolyl cis-trans isomerase B (cyclophilin B)
VPSNEERRQAAREKLERQNERRAAEVRKRKVLGISIGAVAVVLIVAVVGYMALPQGPKAAGRFAAEKRFNEQHVSCNFTDRGDQVAQAKKSIDATNAQIAQAKTQLATLPADQKAAMTDQITQAEKQVQQIQNSIPAIEKLVTRNKTVSKPSGKDVPNTGTTDGTIKTSQGDIGFTLDRSQAPCNAETFSTLISGKYFDDTICHRLTAAPGQPGADGQPQGGLFVLQCGDPTGTGLAGPSWTSPDEIPTELKAAPGQQAQMGQSPTVIYPAGTIAVAKSSSPNSGASQFFLVYKDTWLPADYAVIGKTTDAGLKTVQAIAAKGIAAADFTTSKPGEPITNGKPKNEVRITSMAFAS